MDEAKIRDNQIVERYVLGQLSEEESTEFEEYFLYRPDVLQQIEEVQLLHKGIIAEADQAKILKPTLTTNEGDQAKNRWFDVFQFPIPAYALALSLLVSIPLVSFYNSSKRPQLELAHFSTIAQRSSSETSVIRIEKTDASYGFLVKIAEVNHPMYEARLLAANKVMWSSSSFSLGPMRESLVVLPANELAVGVYQLILLGIDSQGAYAQVDFCHIVENC